MQVSVPRSGRGAVDKPALAMVLAHEMAHIRGMSSERMMRAHKRYGYRSEHFREYYAWANELPLDVAAPKASHAPRGVALAEHRMRVTDAALKRWHTKLKRAQTAIKKLSRRRRYYERRIAAMKQVANHSHALHNASQEE